MGTLDELGKAARNITSIARAGRQVGKLVDDVKDRASTGLGDAESIAKVQRNYKSFQVRVVHGLLEQGWEDEAIAELCGLSPLAVKRIGKIPAKIAKVLGPAEPVEEDVDF
jgi:hypothetical protein